MHLTTNGCISYYFPESLTDSEASLLSEQITRIYLDEENSVWPDDGRYQRISPVELQSMVKNDELILVKNTDSGQIIGCVQVHEENNRWYLSLLVTFPGYRNRGIGSKLIELAEITVVENKANTIYLILLFPEKGEIPRKNEIRKWYHKKGYKTIGNIPFSEKNVEKAKLMKVPCYFELMKKELLLPPTPKV